MSRSSERVILRAATPSFVRRVAGGEQLIAMVSPLLLIALWEALVRIRILDARFFPAPSSIVGTFTSLIASGDRLLHGGARCKRALLGLLAGGVPALALGLAMGLSRWARAALNPIISATYPIPKSAILPLVMLIFGLGDRKSTRLNSSH